MATQSTDISASVAAARLRAALHRAFSGIREGFEAYLTARSRMAEIERLNAKSDEALARIGLRREDIPRHVFRDILYL